MRRSFFTVILLVFAVISVIGQELLPVSGGELIKHKHYTLSYNETHEQANWVYYILNENLSFGTIKRTDNFKVDPLIKSGSASHSDYAHSGYDRGHLCPAEAMSFNIEAMSESFLYSNMSPQAGSLNRGIWKSLEGKVRKWAMSKKQIHVVSGPIFKNNIEKIGKNAVTVPGYYYKIILDLVRKDAIAFVFPNEKASSKLESYVSTIDQVENLTGINFFASVDDAVENEFESKSNPVNWGIDGSIVHTKIAVDDEQCQGKTAKGSRCKRTKKAGSNYCWQHQKK